MPYPVRITHEPTLSRPVPGKPWQPMPMAYHVVWNVTNDGQHDRVRLALVALEPHGRGRDEVCIDVTPDEARQYAEHILAVVEKVKNPAGPKD